MRLEEIEISGGKFLIGQLPEHLILDKDAFNKLWDMHPPNFSTIQMFDKEVFIPRWQQAYGKNYFFSNQTSEALPFTDELDPFILWAQTFNPAYNGLLLNWYDSDLKHYIGKHSDSTTGLVKGSHIITMSLGADRAFRIRKRGKSKGFEDHIVSHGTVIVIPWATNKTHTHEVPYHGKYPGKRISVTARAFSD